MSPTKISPNPSYTSLSSPEDSSSYLSSSCASSSYHAPCTPLRSSRTPKPRPSPLVRLLQPFVLKAPPNTPISTSPTTDTSPFMVLHHPTPHSYQPPSPTNTTGPRPPTPSRSERLLRDALMRDEMERHPYPSSPLVAAHAPMPPSPSSETHRRRHSHIPTSALSRGSPRRGGEVSPDREREEYTRGTFLFRTAMNSPSVPSPTRRSSMDNERKQYYGGDVERATSPMPTTPQHRTGHHDRQHQQHSHPHHHHHHHQPQAQGEPQQAQRQPQTQAPPQTYSSRALRSTQSPSARSISHSPSPMRNRRNGGSLSFDHKPPPLSLDHESPVRRAVSPKNYQQQQHVPPSPGEPLVMTPHEQVLRARLERVLSVGRVVEKGEKEKEVERQRELIHERERRNRELSNESCWGNEVRDEEGGWPWRERESERDRGVWGVEESATTTSPLYSSTSNNSRSSGVSHVPEGSRPMTAVPTNATPTHNRVRSKTNPHSPPPPRGVAVSSPRRSSTAPTPSKVSTPGTQRRQRTGTTPPLVAGAFKADEGLEHDPAADGDAEADDDDDEDLRLLTPPPTPPFTTRMFSFSLGGGVGDAAYCPSPYKAKYSPPVSRGAGQPALGRKNPNSSKKAGLVLGSPRRPRNAPVRDAHSSSSDIGHEHDDHEQDYGAADASCSSSARSSSNSQASYPASDASSSLAHRRQLPLSPPAPHDGHLPQFNARKASARCREIEGYVSFASVEGLGEPPADPMSPDGGLGQGHDAEGAKARGVLGLGVGAAATWGGWRRLLGVAGMSGAPGAGVREEGVVL